MYTHVMWNKSKYKKSQSTVQQREVEIEKGKTNNIISGHLISVFAYCVSKPIITISWNCQQTAKLKQTYWYWAL